MLLSISGLLKNPDASLLNSGTLDPNAIALRTSIGLFSPSSLSRFNSLEIFIPGIASPLIVLVGVSSESVVSSSSPTGAGVLSSLVGLT